MIPLKKLYKIKLMSPMGILRVIISIWTEGINLMTLQKWAALTHPSRIAILDDSDMLSYTELTKQSLQLAAVLKEKFPQKQLKTAVIARNSTAMLRVIFALSRCGFDVYLLNVEIKPIQFKGLNNRYKFDAIFTDREFENLISFFNFEQEVYYLEELLTAKLPKNKKLKRSFGGQLIVLTGGSTGDPKAAARKPSLFHFLNPFFALLRDVHLDKYRSVYIATPIYHGFGVAAAITGIALGATLCLRRKFETESSAEFIEKNSIEVVTLVPLMLKRMLENYPEKLKSLKAILTGGAPLSPDVVSLTKEKSGDKLFNLYGTSEAGFCIMAKPDDLKHSNVTIGRPVKGVKVKILGYQNIELDKGEVGKISVKSAWSVKKSDYIETGDLGYIDSDGLVYLKGRIDDMIVSGGENVYPLELENILNEHPNIKQSVVLGISDEEFGQRLKAFIDLKEGLTLSEKDLRNWLKERCTRYQMPKVIEFKEITFSELGKVNKTGI